MKYRRSAASVLSLLLLSLSFFRSAGVTAAADSAVLPAAPPAWTLTGAVYSRRSLDISANTANARSTDFSPDGTRLYVVGRGSGNIAEYRLTEPWEVETGVFVRELEIDAPAANGLFINKDNGQDLYVFNRSEVQQYRLAQPWVISSARHVRSKTLECENVRLVRGHDIHFKPDGSAMYVEDRLNGEVYQYTLTEPWNVDTLTWRVTLDISDRQRAVRGIELNPDGTRMWLLDTGTNHVHEFHLGKPWALETAGYHQSLNLAGISANSRGITWRPDGQVFYITSTGHQRIYQFAVGEE